MTDYLLVKFLHILVAIVALGTSAGLGIVLEFYGDHRVHGAFVLRAIRRVLLLFVLPGYVLMLATGLWLVHAAWPIATHWIVAALALWGLGGMLLIGNVLVLNVQIGRFSEEGPGSAAYRRISFLGRALGAAVGLVIVITLYLMVVKPGLAILQ